MRRSGIWLAGTVVLGLMVPTGASQAVDVKPEWGSVSTENGVLKKGCRNYRFTYEVTPPDDGYWDLGVSVVGPGGRTLFYSYVSDGSPTSGTASYRLCRSKTRPGRYKLKPVITVMDSNETTQGRLQTVKFRLRDPR